MKKPIYSEEKINEAIKLLKEGNSLLKVSQILNISRTSLFDILKKKK